MPQKTHGHGHGKSLDGPYHENVEKIEPVDAPSMRQAMLQRCPPNPNKSINTEEEDITATKVVADLKFPCRKSDEDAGTVFWTPTQVMLDEWAARHPSLDLSRELKKARGWCVDNPSKRKTMRGMTKFIGTWLANAEEP
jgi:hypothetical protein